MAGESVTFDFIGRGADTLQRDFKGVGDNAAFAAKGARLAADALAAAQRGGKAAADGLQKADLAAARLAVTERELDKEIDKTTRALLEQGGAAETAGRSAEKASGGVSLLTGSGNLSGGGLGALIAAGAVLSPVLVTLGTGFAGLGLAAAGIAKPIADAAGKTGGLAANLKLLDPEQRAVAQSILGLGKQYDQFQKALKPEVLGLFNQGIQIAGHLLTDVQPVAQATGKAFNSFLGQLDKEFSSGQFQQFFKFMADNAAPDMKLLGGNILQLIGLLPTLLTDLQPLATEFLTTSDNALKLAGSIANFGKSTNQTSQAVGTNTGLLGLLAKAVANVSSFMKPGGVAAGALKAGLDGIPGAAGAAGNATSALGADALGAAQHVQSLAVQVNSLTDAENKALTPLLTYTNAVLTQKNDAASLTTALKASGDQVGTNTAAQRASFSAANTYIQDLLNTAAAAQKSHQGIDAQITSITNALPALQNVKGGTTQYWQEVRTLVSWLQKLQQMKLISEKIHISGDGTWAFVQGGGQNVRKTAGAARGMYIASGRPGVDDQLIRAQKGELIVPTPMVASGAVDHLRGRIPGFAAGGIVGSYSGTVGGLQPWGQANWQATVTQISNDVSNAMAQSVKAAVAAQSAKSGAPGAQGGPTSAGAAQAQAYARSRLGAYGWGASQFPPLRSLWQGESGWNRLARNPNGGAYGIPQALPASKMGAAANPPTSSAAAQINWGLGYIKSVYGSPSATYSKWLARSPHWYDQGGILPTGLTLAANGTGKPEHVIPGEGIAGILAELTGILSAIEALTGVVSGPSGSILGGPGVGNSTSIVSPAGGGFGLTRTDLGLPPPSTSTGSSTADTSGGADTSGTAAAPAGKKAKPKPDPAKNAAIKVLTSLLTGDITHNRLAAAQQANSLLDWLGVSSHDKTVRQIASLDRLLAQYRKSKNSRAVAATEQLLRSFGVHDFTPELTVRGNPAKSAVISRIERMIKADIGANNLGAARQDNALLTPLGAHKYTSTLAQIAMFDQLLAKYRKAKDSKDIKATEQILRTYGVKKFAAGGWITEPVTGFGASGQVYQFGEAGRPELVVPASGRGGSAAGSDLGGRLDRLIALHEQLIRTTAAVPAATGRHVAAGVNGAAADAVFRGRYPGR